ncbi:hypothetical protein ACUOFC_68590, partial [Escherichia sp. TWPC-MK]
MGVALHIVLLPFLNNRQKKADSSKSASYESIVLCSNSKKEVRQYGAQRPSLDVAFTCKGDIALNG